MEIKQVKFHVLGVFRFGLCGSDRKCLVVSTKVFESGYNFVNLVTFTFCRLCISGFLLGEGGLTKSSSRLNLCLVLLDSSSAFLVF